MDNIQTKICTICKGEKPLIFFNKSKTGKFGYRAFCKSCQSIDGKKYYDAVERVKPVYGSISDLDNEVWKDIRGYELQYEVSSFGRVKRLTHYVTTKFGVTVLFNELVITPKKVGKNYLKVDLSKDDIKTMFYVHLLVWDHFGDEPRKQGYQIDHIDNDRNNNAISNLQQITIRKNSSKDRKPLSGYTGVTCKNGRHKANIKIGSKGYHLGTFDTAEEAAAAYQKALQSLENKVA
jgi:hypothetical protein